MKGKNYPPPRKGKIFVQRWKLFLPMINTRDNFTESHLTQLEVLCCLYEEFEELTEAVREHGYTYESVGKFGGVTIRPYPEVAQLVTCRSQIAIYTRMLGLTLVKTMAPVGNNVPDEDWG